MPGPAYAPATAFARLALLFCVHWALLCTQLGSEIEDDAAGASGRPNRSRPKRSAQKRAASPAEDAAEEEPEANPHTVPKRPRGRPSKSTAGAPIPKPDTNPAVHRQPLPNSKPAPPPQIHTRSLFATCHPFYASIHALNMCVCVYMPLCSPVCSQLRLSQRRPRAMRRWLHLLVERLWTVLWSSLWVQR